MKKQVRGRKVRIVVSDPYATDESSSDEWFECKPTKVKRIVHEINLPFQLSDGVKSSRRRASRQLNKPVGVRLRQSGKWAAEIRNPITKTKVWLGTYGTLEEAKKAYADKKVEFDASVNSQCLRSAASKEKVSLSKDVTACGDLTKEGFDLSGLEIPDLSFLGAEEKCKVSGVNAAGEIDFDYFFKEEDYGHLFDDFSALDNVNNIGLASELPDCDFTDVELEHGDSKFAFADQVAPPPLNISCP